MSLRTLLFWPHLVAGVLGGALILLMSVTGVLLTYERQMIAWGDRAFRSAPPSPDAPRARIEDVLATVRGRYPGIEPTTITVAADPQAPVALVIDRERTVFADAYTGAVLGEAPHGIRQFMSDLRSWHRWLAVDGEGRPLARAFTGWSNLLFAFIVLSGLYLWVPRTLSWPQLRAVLLFRRGAQGKARDFNWHNVIGIWSAVPLFIVVVSAVPISFTWANAAIYQAFGEPVPAGRGGGSGGAAGGGGGERRAAPEGPGGRSAERQAGSRAGGASRESSSAPVTASNADGLREEGTARAPLAGVDALLARAARQEPDWQTIGVRVPANAEAPLVFAIDRGDGGQPHLRSTLTLGRDAAAFEEYEVFASQTPARRLRSIMRFAHTGEVLGIPGQTIAGLVSFGAIVLVWTGIALAWGRLRAWITRCRRSARPAAATAASPVTTALDPAAAIGTPRSPESRLRVK